MDEDKNKDLELTPEERTAEEEATKEVNIDELKDKLAEDFGLDPDTDEELLDKLIEREKSHREKLSGAIKQKINWRTKFTSKKPEENPTEDKKSNKGETPDIDRLLDAKFAERMEERDLQELNLSDDLKTEVKDLAKLKGISVREAAQLPYILQRKEVIEKEERIKNATPTRSNKGSYTASVDPSKPLNPADFDFNSEEGVKAWKEAKAAREKHMSQK